MFGPSTPTVRDCFTSPTSRAGTGRDGTNSCLAPLENWVLRSWSAQGCCPTVEPPPMAIAHRPSGTTFALHQEGIAPELTVDHGSRSSQEVQLHTLSRAVDDETAYGGLSVKIDAGSHSVLDSRPRLVDPASGSVFLRLLPHHLSRLHPAELRGDFVPCNGDPSSPYQFPLLRGAGPVDVTLQGGMTPTDASAGVVFESAGSQWSRSWWRWIAYALTPFGWVNHPTPEFIRKHTRQHLEEDLLASLSLAPSCGTSPPENFRVAEDWLARELGLPHRSGESVEWRYDWGSVGLTYEPRDGAAEVYILWEPLHSELLAEMEERIGG